LTVIRTSADIVAELRSEVATLSPVPVDVSEVSPVGSLITAFSEVAFRVLQGAQLALDGTNLATATGNAASGIARGQGVERRAATRSRYTTRAQGTGTLAGGETAQGGGPDGRAVWSVVTVGLVTPGDAVIVEAVTPGPLALGSGATTIEMVTTVPGLTSLVWESGVDPAGQVGRSRETDAELRVRVARAAVGLRGRLAAVPWVRASIAETTGPGLLRVTVAPGPIGGDQTAQLVDAIGPSLLGIVSQGTEGPATWIGPDGSTVDVYWEEGQSDPIPVAMTVVLDSGVTVASVAGGITQAVAAYFATLDLGDVVVRQRVIAAALTVAGVVDVTACTLDGSPTNYTPNPVNIAVLAGSVVVS
jgi:hypothetical protein